MTFKVKVVRNLYQGNDKNIKSFTVKEGDTLILTDNKSNHLFVVGNEEKLVASNDKDETIESKPEFVRNW